MFYEAEDAPDLDPAEAMALVAHETRIAILLALWRAEDHELSFSELRRRVDIRDTSKFNYHLSKLEGRFLAHVGDTYELIYPGHRVVDAIQSGALTRRDAVDPFPVAGDCPDCGGDLEFEYEGYVVRIHCQACGQRILRNPFDPAGFTGRDRQAVVVAFDNSLRRLWLSALDGICPTCSAPTTSALEPQSALPEHCHFALTDQPRVVATACDHCSFYAYVPAGIALLEAPAFVAHCENVGVDPSARPFWALPFVADGDRVVLGNQEETVSVRASPNGETIRATIHATDDGVSVAEISPDADFE